MTDTTLRCVAAAILLVLAMVLSAYAEDGDEIPTATTIKAGPGVDLYPLPDGSYECRAVDERITGLKCVVWHQQIGSKEKDQCEQWEVMRR